MKEGLKMTKEQREMFEAAQAKCQQTGEADYGDDHASDCPCSICKDREEYEETCYDEAIGE